MLQIEEGKEIAQHLRAQIDALKRQLTEQEMERSDLVNKMTTERRSWDIEKAQLISKENQVKAPSSFYFRLEVFCRNGFCNSIEELLVYIFGCSKFISVAFGCYKFISVPFDCSQFISAALGCSKFISVAFGCSKFISSAFVIDRWSLDIVLNMVNLYHLRICNRS